MLRTRNSPAHPPGRPAPSPWPRRLALAVATLLALAAAATPARAWNGAGHRLSASLAWPHLDEGARQEVSQLLAAHADYSVFVFRAGSEAPADLLGEAATWPDDIRRDPRFHDGDGEPAANAADRARHRDWHYVDQPISGTAPGPLGGQLHLALPLLAARVADRALPAALRAEALAWLCHLVGDVHQPLHTATRLDHSPGDGDDEGGNGLPVTVLERKWKPQTNLHSYWDDLPGVPWLRGARLQRRARQLAEQYPAASVVQGDFRLWRAESHALARDFAYPAVTTTPHPLDSAYQRQAARHAAQRVAAAGHRLGRLLNALLGAPAAPPTVPSGDKDRGRPWRPLQ